MVNLRNRIKRVIKFSRAQEQKQAVICSAIRQLRPIEFYYMHGYRTVEPFALGIVLSDHQDNMSILCWQTAGFSDLNEILGWKLYRVSDMEDIEVQNQHFTGIRPGYAPENLEMAQVICCVPAIQQASEIPSPPAIPIVQPIPELKIVDNPPAVDELPPPPPPPVQIRPIVRVISHNQLMERFRYAHPQPIPQLEDLLWQEPLTAPFPEPSAEETGKAAATYVDETVQAKIWPDTPVKGVGIPEDDS
jgi:hypothetical protein